MCRHFSGAGLVVVLLGAGACAQTVQLPTFQQFAVGTTVVVPDRGTSVIAGSRRVASSSSQFPGVPGNRSAASALGTSGLSVSAQIHDFEALDAAVLEEAARLRAAEPAAPAVRRIRPRTSEPAAMSLAQIERHKAARTESAENAGRELLARAQAARAKGHLGAARVYYQMALRRLEGSARAQALAELQAVSPGKPSSLTSISR